jgi:uncharacterized protein (DUF433 family)
MDWSGCELVEVVPGKVSGQPLVKDTRIPADFVVESYELAGSVDEVLEEFPRLTAAIILELVEYARLRQGAAAVAAGGRICA